LRGYTLAEVLLTIGILGVVAAMTIPTLMQNSQNKELVSHYLKMNNILSNALKNTEATEQTKFYKLSETDFKTKFESHLKTTGCDADAGDSNFTPNVCFADGSQFAYGTFDESCTDNICDTLTIDTNGKKGPNTAGKDRFTMNLTPNGLKALGESDSCENGLDCGAYILAHHKLYQIKPCANTTGGYCKLDNGEMVYDIGHMYVTHIDSGGYEYATDTDWINKYHPDTPHDWWEGAKQACLAKDMELPDFDTLWSLYESNSYPKEMKGTIWSSDLSVHDNIQWAKTVNFTTGEVAGKTRSYTSNMIFCVKPKS
ncbi:type II secretion system protein, partial [bacterium]|nr:type II secretion system protein [bacterium]